LTNSGMATGQRGGQHPADFDEAVRAASVGELGSDAEARRPDIRERTGDRTVGSNPTSPPNSPCFCGFLEILPLISTLASSPKRAVLF
jgi:hypothetical protein